jgi:hypothetical protein
VAGGTRPRFKDGNQEGAFRLAAGAKRREITARLGRAAKQSHIVLEYCPTENELKAVLNRKYPLPVKEVHIFSHVWEAGINLGGPDPGMGRVAPDERPQERRVVPSELGDYQVQWADQPSVVLYGCKTGNPVGSPPFAQSVSDAFGVPVTGSTTTTEFDFTGPWGAKQVPVRPGRMVEFTPTRTAIDDHMRQAESVVKRIVSLRSVKGGLVHMSAANHKALALRSEFNRHAEWLQRVLSDPRFTIAERARLRERVRVLVKRARALLATR